MRVVRLLSGQLSNPLVRQHRASIGLKRMTRECRELQACQHECDITAIIRKDDLELPTEDEGLWPALQ